MVSVTDCSQPSLTKNGYCNDQSNKAECFFDGGDCCGICVNTDFCTNCSCIDDSIDNGIINPLLGDGFCNDQTNNAQCFYDWFDCCQSPLDTTFCTNCSCHGTFLDFFLPCIK